MRCPFIPTRKGAAGAPRGEPAALCVEQREDPVLEVVAADKGSHFILVLVFLLIFFTHKWLETL